MRQVVCSQSKVAEESNLHYESVASGLYGITFHCDVVQSPIFMRRTLASLLLAVLLTGFGLPLLQAQSAAPACCRRNGQHHCSAPATNGGYRSLAACSFYRHFRALTTHGNSALGVSTVTAFVLTVAQQPTASLSVLMTRDFPRSNSQRGPPPA